MWELIIVNLQKYCLFVKIIFYSQIQLFSLYIMNIPNLAHEQHYHKYPYLDFLKLFSQMFPELFYAWSFGTHLYLICLYFIILTYMVFIPRINFKSGINPSRLATFPLNGVYAGTQRLLLTRTRIFGDKISGNYRSGMKQWRQTYPGRFMYYANQSVQLHDIQRDIPGMVDDYQTDTLKAMKLYKQEKRLQKQAKKAAKEAKKKK